MKAILSRHAKEQAFQRYGILFTRRMYKDFLRAMRNPKRSIRLDNNRLACYFGGSWYLLVYVNGQVLTFLPPESLSANDKHRLRYDERYRRTGNDVFQVGAGKFDPPTAITESPELPAGLPDSIPDVELPQDILDAAAKLLPRLCDRPQE